LAGRQKPPFRFELAGFGSFCIVATGAFLARPGQDPEPFSTLPDRLPYHSTQQLYSQSIMGAPMDAYLIFGTAVHAALCNFQISNIFQKRLWMPFHYPG